MAMTIDRDTRLEIIRRAYAKQIMAAEGVVDRRVENAFATVPREDFLGRGPWPILRWGRGYVPSPSADPVYLYADLLVGIIPEQQLNNGQPSFLARLIAAAAPKPGEHAVHIGAGVGYYSAILAYLVGRRGRVTAIEYEAVLAARLTQNLAVSPQVTAVHGDGTRVDFAPAEVILVNAGATGPAAHWLDRLAEGGRMILPLTTAAGFGDNTVPFERRGAVFRIERRGDHYDARRISGVGIYPCHGMRDANAERALSAAFERGGAERVTRLYRGGADIADEDCWLRGEGWCLAYR